MKKENNLKLKFILNINCSKGERKVKLTKEFPASYTLKQVLIWIYHKYSKSKYKVDIDEHNILISNPNLFEYIYKFKGIEYEPSVFEYENYEIEKLDNQFDISKKNLALLLDYGIGSDIGRCKGVHLFFHTNEKDIHHQPHIHCRCSSEEFRVCLNSLKIMNKDKPFKNKKRTELALELVKLNQDELIKYWNDVVIHGETVKLKIYIPKHY